MNGPVSDIPALTKFLELILALSNPLSYQCLYLLVSILPAGNYTISQVLQNLLASFGMPHAQLAQLAAVDAQRFHVLDRNG